MVQEKHSIMGRLRTSSSSSGAYVSGLARVSVFNFSFDCTWQIMKSCGTKFFSWPRVKKPILSKTWKLDIRELSSFQVFEKATFPIKSFFVWKTHPLRTFYGRTKCLIHGYFEETLYKKNANFEALYSRHFPWFSMFNSSFCRYSPQ